MLLSAIKDGEIAQSHKYRYNFIVHIEWVGPVISLPQSTENPPIFQSCDQLLSSEAVDYLQSLPEKARKRLQCCPIMSKFPVQLSYSLFCSPCMYMCSCILRILYMYSKHYSIRRNHL